MVQIRQSRPDIRQSRLALLPSALSAPAPLAARPDVGFWRFGVLGFWGFRFDLWGSRLKVQGMWRERERDIWRERERQRERERVNK